MKKALLATSMLVATAAMGHAEGIRIANFGGSYGDAMAAAIWDPIAEARGIEIGKDTFAGIADVRAQVRANSIGWDIGELTIDECAIGSREGLFQNLNLTSEETEGYPENAVHEDYILVNTASYVPVWQGNVMPLTSWADFWDVENFPGPRALRDDPMENLVAALIADGVPLEEVYPLDVDRAFRKLEEIKPEITTWWSSGAQGAQLLSSGEVDYAGGWTTRVGALINEGVEVGYTLNGGIMIPDCLFIPSGAKSAELARDVLKDALSVELQKSLPEYIDASPINQDVYAEGILAPEILEKQVATPENMKLQVLTDGVWWAEHGNAVKERWQEFKAQ
ncbi:ABC transporter substrate-binding protein [Paracoccus pantotrophus]|uniref:ABC transporter substrate-binding protein n=1 Tax=Paracoccus pantotrophus TaxID=82367 RepID=A0A7H9BP28_PARPN|nr:ABC transporter substrate-binding protein [Paracoccus pantotrophus]QLH13067.1 ABC transporter substrate-binding protein [Paracoccus pantotrophus]